MNSRIILNLNLIFKNSKNLNKSFYTINNKCARKEASLFRSKSNNQFQLVRLNSTVPKSFKERYFNITWRSVIVVALSIGAGVMLMWKVKYDKQEMLRKNRLQSVGKMAIGGPFDLIDVNGKPVSSKDLAGNWLLIYFGFTHCPDVCPVEIEKMIKAVDYIDKVNIKDQKILPIFITVDPDRDDIKAVEKYVKEFSPKLIGLTGSKEQIDQVTKAYRVYFSQGPPDEEKDYIVDHTIITYLVDPAGEFVDYYGQQKKPNELASAVAIHMSTWSGDITN